MSRRICGFQSRKVAAFLAGLVTGVLIGGVLGVRPGPGRQRVLTATKPLTVKEAQANPRRTKGKPLGAKG